MTRKVVKIEYVILEGEIDNEPPPKVYSYRNHMQPEYGSHTSVIALPDKSGKIPDLPIPLERYKIIQACKDAGIDVGVEVIRAQHVSRAFVSNPRMIGTVQRFTFQLFQGQSRYMPIIVRFETSGGYVQDFPMCLDEIETVENARKQLGMIEVTTPMKRQETIGEEIIKDILRERHGVLPFNRMDQHPFDD